MGSGGAWKGFYGFDGSAVDLPDPQGIWQAAILSAIKDYQEELHDECGEFTLSPSMEADHQYEIILTAHGGSQFRCYMSDHHADARLILDDYIPEVHGGIPVE